MFNDLLIRVRALLRREAVENELDEELRFHYEKQVEKYMQSGMLREEARRRARLEFGGADQIKEECRDARGVSFLKRSRRMFGTVAACCAEHRGSRPLQC